VRTNAPGHDVLLFDGECAFCRGAAGRLLRWIPAGGVEPRSFREPDALARFPGLSPAHCEQALQLVREDGEVFAGIDGAVEALRHGRLGWLARAYRLPGIRQIADALYRLIARIRYRIGGRTCISGACGR
jgi:predicted DCC family thiol-disulfide oxidoreductase YuxK